MNSGQNNVNMVLDHDMFGSMWVAEQKAKEANKGRIP
jgi:hypothetical protein